MKERPHKKLKVWQRSMDLYVDVYRLTRDFPREEIYGITSQMRRAALSIPSNISEGAARHYPKEFLRHLSDAEGSLSELDTQLEAAFRVQLIQESDHKRIQPLIEEVAALLHGLIRSLEPGI
ncbi:MAG: four helix bundle protein [Candidatus Methylacidiphilales bacterium]|nr:four helix bundle protein [Candidatus Methylacidiphilales bacterium]